MLERLRKFAEVSNIRVRLHHRRHFNDLRNFQKMLRSRHAAPIPGQQGPRVERTAGVGMTTLQPIETSYRGYRFRSRLEARWAVFLDAAEIQWEYESEGFDLSGTYYLPDFWLPGQRSFLEIKPRASEWLDTIKQLNPILSKLADTSHCEAYLIRGTPSLDIDNHPTVVGFAPNKGVCSARFFECQFCGQVSIDVLPDRRTMRFARVGLG
jgi:hypothetical protein